MNTDSKTANITEKSDTQIFWLGLLRDVLGIEYPEKYIEFEKRVEIQHMSFIDAYIPSTGVIIEQKGPDVNLDTPLKHSDGSTLTPFEQAKRYYDWLPRSQKGQYIITCNFHELRIYDMETPKAPPTIIMTDKITKDNLAFIVNQGRTLPHEVELSIRAGELVSKLYDSILERYIKPDDKDSLRSLNVFCVRLVFLLYAEDSGLFAKSQFHDYLKSRETTARDSLKKLFAVLNQEADERDPYLEADLKAFPCVNGGLFEADNIELPQIGGEPLRIILDEMSEGFDWSGISPTIFGAIFESILNSETRHSGGMHYTSIENIHKVIDPLFLDDLHKEFETCHTPAELKKLQKKIAALKFFDPACGSGNFLTETYLSLRRLENRILAALPKSEQIYFTESKTYTPIRVSISQFYGIEINDFAVNVARTALWIAESQMWDETREIVLFFGERLPLKNENHIIERNALRVDWKNFLPSTEKIYIIGNPPYMGYSNQSKRQKEDILLSFIDENGKPYKTAGKIDYVAGWYFKASEMVQDSRVKAAFLSTNSITQGEQVSYVFKTLHERFGIEIDFAHQSFIWDSEATDKAHVHCVIIGFSVGNDSQLKRLYTHEGLRLVDNINFYLVPGPNVFAEPINKALCKEAKPMRRGSQPTDDGNLLLTADEMLELVAANPIAKKFIRPFMMGADFIQRKPRYCLWLVNANPDEIMKCPKVTERVKAVRDFRLASKKPATQRKAETPTLFDERVECMTNYIAIPKTSSENRFYIPIDWLDNSVIPGDALRIIPDATLYDFGILTSRVHMAWMRAVCGRLEMRYSYSNTIVYNTFAWPSPTKRQCLKIESTAQMILDARALYPDSSLAALYNDMFMPPELRKAHRLNDSAVCEAYGWPSDISEDEITARLFRLYHQLTK
ncbi:MAG: class I SAM-dependent DNA methyltransferase [Synergistaceae bacterium]|nr:class I SAM-dependent DNA methyltransferase [Synergistaceae bacterium]